MLEKDSWLQVRMSKTERDDLHMLAREYGMTTSAFIRAVSKYFDKNRPVIELTYDAPKKEVV